MDSIHLSSPPRNRRRITAEIQAVTDKLISAYLGYRSEIQILPRSDERRKPLLLLDFGDTITKTIKLFAMGKPDFTPFTNGVTETGIPWLLRVISRMVITAIEKATIAQLLFVANLLRGVADSLMEIAESEGAENHGSDVSH